MPAKITCDFCGQTCDVKDTGTWTENDLPVYIGTKQDTWVCVDCRVHVFEGLRRMKSQ